jgi:hypothetical protein
MQAIYSILPTLFFTMTFVSSKYEVSGNIADMSVSDGLKHALVKCGFIDRQQILSYTTGELASILEIDQYVTKLILEAANV